MYWHGDWQDLCRGPHLQHTGQVPADAFKLMSIAGAYWRGDSDRAMLQRIYGVAFTSKEELQARICICWKKPPNATTASWAARWTCSTCRKKPPVRCSGTPTAGRSTPNLQDYMRRKQTRGGYVEVNTPQVVDRKLWEASGHWDKYQEHMFIVEVDEEHAREKAVNALKPMNCPCHVQIFNQG